MEEELLKLMPTPTGKRAPIKDYRRIKKTGWSYLENMAPGETASVGALEKVSKRAAPEKTLCS